MPHYGKKMDLAGQPAALQQTSNAIPDGHLAIAYS
jgi:hypothetical protein